LQTGGGGAWRRRRGSSWARLRPAAAFPPTATPIARILYEVDETLAIEIRNTRGSNENIVALNEGQLDLGRVTGEVTYEAINALGRPKADGIRVCSPA
jgi:uncharacterized protein